MNRLKMRFKLALWAFLHPNNLTMLKNDLQKDGGEKNSQGRASLSSHRAWWYLHYLDF